MPTENRSSNNESVRLPRDLVDLALAHLPNDSAAKWEIYELLGQPAQQHQGEQVTLPARKDPTQGWAVPGGVAKADGWNEYHDEIAKLGPLYTHPAPTDPGEAERLRDEIDGLGGLREKLSDMTHARDLCFDDTKKLRAQMAEKEALAARLNKEADGLARKLAEAHALLLEVVGDVHFVIASDTRERIDAHLSASAEPAKDANAGEVERLRAEVAKFRGCCVDLDSEKRELEHKMDAYKGAAEEAAALRAQLSELKQGLESQVVEGMRADAKWLRDELDKALLQLAEAHALLRKVRKFGWTNVEPEERARVRAEVREHLSASAEPSAPVEVDERKEFEKAVIDKAERFHPELRQYGDQPDAEYRDANIEWAWGLWQARAALERKSVEPLPPVDGDLLPPIGSKVLIHLGREDKWAEHTVVGYYAWGNHGLDQNVYRVFVRVRDAEGYLNARLLRDVRPVDEALPQP